MDTILESVYVALIMTQAQVRIALANESHLSALEVLVQSIATQNHPDQPGIANNASQGLHLSLQHFNVLASDCAWVFIAFADDQPAGLAVLTRIPKLDPRRGFLYLDELHVITKYRRQGIGKALMTTCIDFTRNLGLAGLRLLARLNNDPARHLYEAMGFTGNETMLYQLRVDRGDRQP